MNSDSHTCISETADLPYEVSVVINNCNEKACRGRVQQFLTVIGDLPGDEGIDNIAESVDELRAKLSRMKRLMEARKGTTLGDLSARKKKETSDIIDGNFLSWVFGSALVVILSVSFYAFYNLYHAVLKKFPSHHTEL